MAQNFAELHASQGALAIVSILLSCYYVRLTFGMWTMIQVTFTLVWTSWIVAYSLDAPREVLAAQCLSSQDLKAKEFCRDHIAFAWVPFVLHFLANTTVFTAVMHRNLRPRVARTSGIAYTLVKGGALLAINSWNMSAGVRSIFLGGTIRAFAWFTAGDIVWLYFYIAFTIYGGGNHKTHHVRNFTTDEHYRSEGHAV